MSGYPGGMSKAFRNRLWFCVPARYCTDPRAGGQSEWAVNEFVDWVAANKPVTSRAFVRSAKPALLWNEWATERLKAIRDDD